MRYLLLLTVAVSVSFVLHSTALAQAPLKSGLATPRERQYILTAKRTYGQSLSIEEARLIAQTEDAIKVKAKDKTKQVWLLRDYLEWRTARIKEQRDKKAAEDRAEYLADAPLRMEQEMARMRADMQDMQLKSTPRTENWYSDGHGGYLNGHGGAVRPDGHGGFTVDPGG